MLVCLIVLIFFFFKQKTAYEMRISDWSSDVCSSDLAQSIERLGDFSDWSAFKYEENGALVCFMASEPAKAEGTYTARGKIHAMEIGRASCRERVCQYVEI